MSPLVTVVDYGIGNIHSVVKALVRAGADVRLTSEAAALKGSERVVLPDATTLLDYMQDRAQAIVEGMLVYPERMRENLELTHGAVHSQRALTALVESGMDRDAAYRIVQESAQRAWDEGTSFRDLLAEKLATSPAAPEVADEEAAGIDLDAVFDPGAYLAHLPEVFKRLEDLRD